MEQRAAEVARRLCNMGSLYAVPSLPYVRVSIPSTGCPLYPTGPPLGGSVTAGAGEARQEGAPCLKGAAHGATEGSAVARRHGVATRTERVVPHGGKWMLPSYSHTVKGTGRSTPRIDGSPRTLR